MSTYILLSSLTDEGAETLKYKPERLIEVNEELKALGVEVVQQYAVLGPYDFVNIVEAPDNATIARVSIELASRGSVSTRQALLNVAGVPLPYAAALGLALSAAADSHQPAAAPVKGWSGIVAKFKQSWLLGTDDA